MNQNQIYPVLEIGDNNSKTVFFFLPLVFLAGPLISPVTPVDVVDTATLYIISGVVLNSMSTVATVVVVMTGLGLFIAASSVVTGVAAVGITLALDLLQYRYYLYFGMKL